MKLSDKIQIPESEIEISAIGARGPGGQGVNKSATAVHLRFDIHGSSLPDELKNRLMAENDKRISRSGVVVIKSMRYRSLEANREDALQRLYMLIRKASVITKPRKPVKPGPAARRRRLESKTRRSRIKSTRGKIDPSRD